MSKARKQPALATDVALTADSSGAGSSGVHGEVVFAAYYREQGIVPEVEWERFQEVLARPLPTFRPRYA